MSKSVPCPICGRSVAFDHPNMPFCSDRCRVLDLGNWASEKYGIPSAEQSEFEEIDAEEQQHPSEGSGR